MSSVTKRIGEIKQPRGGYIKPSQFEIQKNDDGCILCENENIHGSVVGMAVDYLTRFAMGEQVAEAFRISYMGAKTAEEVFGKIDATQRAIELMAGINCVDERAVVNACKLVTYDVWRRNPIEAMMSKGADEINPDKETIRNIMIMVRRSVEFLAKYGPIVKVGFTFEPDGYTETVDSGDGDYLTSDTLWDFKVSKSKPTNKHTLQLLMYWIMGQHSGQEIYKNIQNLGIFNPRRHETYLLRMDAISRDLISEIERDVICY